MINICRTCSQSIDDEEYFSLNGSSYTSNALRLKDMLMSCLPELNLNIVANSIMCRNCVSSLHIAYYFKLNAAENEKTFCNILWNEENAIKEEVILNNVDDINTIEIETDFMCNDPETNKEEQEVNSDDHSFGVEYVDLPPLHEYAESRTRISDGILECPPLIPFDERFEILESLSHNSDLNDSDANVKNDGSNKSQKMDIQNLIKQISLGNDAENNVEIDYDDLLLKNDSGIVNKNLKVSEKYNLDLERPYKCSDCDYQAKIEINLKMHRMIHTGEKPFHCSVCPYRAKRKSHLEDHMTTHTKKRPYKCPLCSKCFLSKYQVRMHCKIHTGEKPFKCNLCTYTSRLKNTLLHHIKRMHMGITKPKSTFICDSCGKQLSSASSLSAHKRVHTGVKSHLCELCGRYFRERTILLNHLQIHTGEKPFKCSKCDFVTNRKGNLHDHMKTHIGRDNLFECEECGKCFSTKVTLSKHAKQEHKNEDSGET